MKKILASIVISFLILPVHSAAAHVLITDDTKTKGAILHINPDDDPIAGQASTLYLDTQDQLTKDKDVAVSLLITDSTGKEITIPMKLSGTLAAADYIFPVQGLYHLSFKITSGSKTTVFEQSQRVSRGTAGSALDRPSHAWAEILALISGISIILLAIAVFNRRETIAKQSTF